MRYIYIACDTMVLDFTSIAVIDTTFSIIFNVNKKYLCREECRDEKWRGGGVRVSILESIRGRLLTMSGHARGKCLQYLNFRDVPQRRYRSVLPENVFVLFL